MQDLKMFTTFDSHLSTKQLYYPVSSIYFENAKLQAYVTKIDGLAKRYKLRIRSYYSQEHVVHMLEIKYKLYDKCLKERMMINPACKEKLILGKQLNSLELLNNPVLEHAVRYQYLSQLVPFIQIDYNRKALFGIRDKQIRITIDFDIKCVRYHVHTNVKPYIPVLSGAVILEIKTRGYFPYWLTCLVHKYGLKRAAISKYVLSVQRIAMNSSLCVQ